MGSNSNQEVSCIQTSSRFKFRWNVQMSRGWILSDWFLPPPTITIRVVTLATLRKQLLHRMWQDPAFLTNQTVCNTRHFIGIRNTLFVSSVGSESLDVWKLRHSNQLSAASTSFRLLTICRRHELWQLSIEIFSGVVHTSQPTHTTETQKFSFRVFRIVIYNASA